MQAKPRKLILGQNVLDSDITENQSKDFLLWTQGRSFVEVHAPKTAIHGLTKSVTATSGKIYVCVRLQGSGDVCIESERQVVKLEGPEYGGMNFEYLNSRR